MLVLSVIGIGIQRNLNFGVHWDQSYLMGRRYLFSLVGLSPIDGVTIKMPYWVDVLLS